MAPTGGERASKAGRGRGRGQGVSGGRGRKRGEGERQQGGGGGGDEELAGPSRRTRWQGGREVQKDAQLNISWSEEVEREAGRVAERAADAASNIAGEDAPPGLLPRTRDDDDDDEEEEINDVVEITGEEDAVEQAGGVDEQLAGGAGEGGGGGERGGAAAQVVVGEGGGGGEGGAAAQVVVEEEEGLDEGVADVGPRLPSLEEVHTTAIPTHKWPPKASRSEFTREMTTLWDRLANNMNDTQLWVKLLMFPLVIIPASAPRSSEQSLGDQVKARLRRWRAGEAAQLWQEAVQMTEKQPRRGRKKRGGEEELSEEEKLRKRNAKRAATMAGEGQYARACQALTSAGMAEHNRQTVKVMREKHPAAQQPIGDLPTTDHAPLSFTSTQVVKAALKFRKGSAGGPSGLRPEHLRVVLQSTNTRRDSAAVALTRFLNQMMAGKVPAIVAPYLCGARLHAGKKKDGGLRPIAVGELLRRLVSKCAAAAVADKAAAYFAPHQLGVGMKGGCESIIHATRQAVDKAGDKFVMRADLINAFNVADRATALREVEQHFPELLPWVITAYSTPSHLIFGSTNIWSRSGFHQGDPLASLLFSLVLHPLVLEIQEQVSTLDLNAWYLDDGTLVGTVPELRQVVDIMVREGPARGLILSTAHTTRAPSLPKTTVWSKLDVTGDDDPLGKGVPRVRGLGITLLGAPLGHLGYEAELLQEKVNKVQEITSLLPDIQDPQIEFCLLRSCLSLPKIMFTLRTVDTTAHRPLLSQFDRETRESLNRILGAPLDDLQWRQAKLPVALGGMGLRAAMDHGAAAFSTSLLQSQPMVRQLLNTAEDEPAPLSPTVLATLSIQTNEETTVESLTGLTQRMVGIKVDLANQTLHTTRIQEAGEREVARMASLCLPQAGAWLNCPPLPALGLHLRGPEFVVAAKFRLGMPVYNSAGSCPACGRHSDMMGDHGMVCGTGGERIARHNALRDALHDTAAAAGLAPQKEGRALLPGNNQRPADIFIPRWAGGRDAALDVTVTHPLQDATRARAAAAPGHALAQAYKNKMRGTAEQCDQQGIAFIPMVAESLGGWHKVALDQMRKLGSALARHTGQEEGETISHLLTRASVLLQKGLSALLLNRIPGHPAPAIGGVE